MRIHNKLKILDCSLRDGGYYTNWDFSRSLVENYYEGINNLPIDYVEIGYRSTFRPGYYGAYFYCPESILNHAAQFCKKKLALILNEKEVKIGQIDELLRPCKDIVSLIRLAVAPNKLDSAMLLTEKIKKAGFEVSINVMYFSKWKREWDFSAILDGADLVDYIYLVDSYGGVYPTDIKNIFESFVSLPGNIIGFHAHNNLELAHINTLTAIEFGAGIVDATIAGIGRGAGNLKMELLLTSLHAQGKVNVDFEILSNTVSPFENLKKEYRWGTNLAYMVSGANSLPQQEVMSQMNKRYFSLESIVRGLDNKSKGLSDNVNLGRFNPQKKFKNAIIIGGGKTGTTHSFAVLEFLNRNRDTALIHASSKNAKAYADFSDPQFHCLVGNEGRRLEEIFKNLATTDKVGVLPPYPRIMGTYIPDALRDNVFQLGNFEFINKHLESVTALAIETSYALNVENLFFVGYDGYESDANGYEVELFKENDALFAILTQTRMKFNALTPTKYNNLPQSSIFSKI